MWMAGGGVKAGHDLRRDRRLLATTSSRTRSTSATSTPPCCNLLGFDHERFTYRYQGLDQKLTGVEPAQVIKELLA